MKSFIFDVDGTLIDSYKGILNSTMNVLAKHNIFMNSDDVLSIILKHSVVYLFDDISKEYNVDRQELSDDFDLDREKTKSNYKFMPNAIDTLKKLKNNGASLFIYTHKGASIYNVLKSNDIDNLFLDVIHSGHPSFRRKPDPYALNHLIDKYNLNKDETFYVGDRSIDIECAFNANIKSVLYKSNKFIDDTKSTYKIDDFNELLEI